MQILNVELLPAFEAYSLAFLLPGITNLESEDEDWMRFSTVNLLDREKSNSSLESIIEKNNYKAYGHYIRYYGFRRRIKPFLRKLSNEFIDWKIRFSDDGNDAAIVSHDEKYFLRLRLKGLNYYITHFSIDFMQNKMLHESFLCDFKKFPFQPNLRVVNKNKAMKKLVASLCERV
ncbi:hypothetical protein LL967_07805 [Xanthomonas campestris pv. zinniae]|nr:hypothetical protein [Xanthomonas campestris pv. zinniae]